MVARSPLGIVIVHLEKVDVVVQRHFDNRALEELVDILDSVASGLRQEEDGPERGTECRAGEEEVGSPLDVNEKDGSDLGDDEVEEPVGHQAHGHRDGSQVVGDRFRHCGPGCDGPSKGVERSVEVYHNNRYVRGAVDFGRAFTDLTVTGDVEHGKGLTKAAPDE